MLREILLRLRNGRDRVSVIRPNGSTRPVLGTVHPQDDDRRASVARQLGGEREPPRKEPLANIEEPLPTRTQTILSYSVPTHVRQAINGDVTDAVSASRVKPLSINLDL